MVITDWLDLNLSEIKNSLLFGKYFDSIGLEDLIGEYSLFNPQLGIDIILRDDLSVKAIHFFSGKSNEANRFSGELPFALDFSNSRDFTRNLFGEPEASGGGDFSELYGKTPFWDRHKNENHVLHLQFVEDLSSIDLITVYSKKEVIG